MPPRPANTVDMDPEERVEHKRRICEWVALGRPVTEYCQDVEVPEGSIHPTPSLISTWAAFDPEFHKEYYAARNVGYDVLADQCLMIVDRKLHPRTDDDVSNEHVLRQRQQQVDTRLKLLARWDPKRYGDKLAVGGDPTGVPLRFSDVERAAKIKAILASAQLRNDVEDLQS